MGHDEQSLWRDFDAATSNRRNDEVRQRAFNRLGAVIRPKANNYVKRIVGAALSAKLSRAFFDPEDIVQETLLELWKRKDLRSPRAWFYRRLEYGIRRRIKKFAFEAERDPYVREHESALHAQPQRSSGVYCNLVRHLHEAIRSLPNRSRQIVRLHHIEGYTEEVVARKLNIKSASVGRALNRAIPKLEAILRSRGILS